MDLILKGAIGGLVIISIGLISRQVGPMAAGIMVWFPVITFAGVIIIALQGPGTEDVKSYVKGAILSLPIWLAFATTLYLSLERMTIPWAVALSSAVWLVGAIIFVSLASP
jgi:uncharacterized membrane protein (GlpM family)